MDQYILTLRGGGGGGGGGDAPQKNAILDAFFRLFFQNFACGAESLAKTRTKPCLGRTRKIISVDLKKIRQNFRFFFRKSAPPPPEKILDPRLLHLTVSRAKCRCGGRFLFSSLSVGWSIFLVDKRLCIHLFSDSGISSLPLFFDCDVTPGVNIDALVRCVKDSPACQKSFCQNRI